MKLLNTRAGNSLVVREGTGIEMFDTAGKLCVACRSPLTGQMNERWLPITWEQLNELSARSRLVQDIFPSLSPSDREFLLTGYTDEDWKTMFPPEEDEDHE
jgi:hypothetical protein